MKNNRLIKVALLTLAMTSVAQAQTWGPWSVNSDTPTLLTSADRENAYTQKKQQTEDSVAAAPFIWLLKVYQNFISPFGGQRCAMYPTCSQYSMQAIRKHGPVIGIIMTSDRLIHEADEQRLAPLIKVGNRYRYPDSVENNDFWWYRE